jgi:hypothetical protein
MNNPIWQDPKLLKLWMLCLLEASHKDHEQLVGKQIIKLQPGQFVTGRFSLSKVYNDGAKKINRVPEITLWRWLRMLETYEFLNIKTTTKYSVVTINNWDKYQPNEQQMNIKRTTNEQQMNTNNNGNKGNNDKNEKENIILSAFEDFWSAYPRKLDKKKAFEKFKSAAKKHNPQIIVQGAINYARDCEIKRTEKQFVKHPTTFLNAESFLNDFDGQPIKQQNYQKKPTHQEYLPDWFEDPDKPINQSNASNEDLEKKKAEIAEKLKKIRGDG